MSSRAMPSLVLNLSAEMMYVLKQRLDVGSISAAKKAQVLSDVMSAICDPAFLAEVFRPQKLYTRDAVKLVFSKLAHSSIMKLNETSMGKLFDLMTTGVKRQVMCVAAPEDLLLVTLNHFEALETMMAGASKARSLLRAARERFTTAHTADRFTLGDWQRLRQTLCTFFQERRVKVALFLREGLQKSNATIMLSLRDPMLPRNAEAQARSVAAAAAVAAGPDAVGRARAARFEDGDVRSAAYRRRRCRLGRNLYDARTLAELHSELRVGGNFYCDPRSPGSVEQQGSGGAGDEREEDGDGGAGQSKVAEARADAEAEAVLKAEAEARALSSSRHARVELSMLAQLLGSAAATIAGGGDHQPLPIDLSRDALADPIFGTATAASRGHQEHHTPSVVRIESARAHAATKAEMMSKFGLDDDEEEEEEEEEEARRGRGTKFDDDDDESDDLLAMMDG